MGKVDYGREGQGESDLVRRLRWSLFWWRLLAVVGTLCFLIFLGVWVAYSAPDFRWIGYWIDKVVGQ